MVHPMRYNLVISRGTNEEASLKSQPLSSLSLPDRKSLIYVSRVRPDDRQGEGRSGKEEESDRLGPPAEGRF